MLSLLFALAAVATAIFYTDLSQDLPSLQELPALLEPPGGLLLQPTRLYDRTGEHVLLSMENPAAADRQYLQVKQSLPTDIENTEQAPQQPGEMPGQDLIPSSLISATVASADPSFWSNPGFSMAGLAQSTHLTLAQKLVSDLLLWDEKPGVRRALRERLLAAQITSHYGKQKVLEWYLNSANYGRLAYGADAAARLYFGKPAPELDLAESALLAAVAQAPALNPIDAPQAALERQRDLISRMLEQGFIDSEQADQALHEKLSFEPPPPQPENVAPAFTALVIRQLQAYIDRDRLERGGFQVITTLDYTLQLQSACAAATQLARLQSPVQADPLAADGSECQAARLLPTLPTRTVAPDFLGSMGANVVVLNPQSGDILAMVGQPQAGLDPSETPGHSPGSILTPFIYLAGFTRGMGPATLVWDIPDVSSASSSQNYDGKFHGPVRLRLALANDYLVPAVKVLAQVGAENVWRSARQLGLSSLRPPVISGPTGLPFDGGEITLLEASQAFGVFASQGKLVGRALETPLPGGGLPTLQAAAIQKVQDETGRVWLDWNTNSSRPVVNPQLAYLMTNILSDEAARWPSLGHPNALEIGRPAATKLGRTPSGLGAWTIGYTPQMVVGVWMGQKDEAISGQDLKGQGANDPLTPNLAAALWHAIIQYASQGLPSLDWAQPPGISSLDVCDPSGMLPTPDCPSVVSEVFLQGNEPTQADDLFRKVEINRASGNLATIFTPSDLVEERVYMNVPAEAAEWARTAGLATLPENYDVVAAPTPTSPDVQIDSPGMFAYVRGKVKITGRASGQNLDFYRIQVGQGLNPQEWLQIGQDVNRPVNSGELGTWDTSELSGLYAVQLLVVRQDQHVESAIVQVTVDNLAPSVQILYPQAGQELPLLPSRTVTFQFNASDDLALAQVQVLVDDKLLAVLKQAPFALPWNAQPGNHTLLVVASDMAGNQSQDKIHFSVK